MKSNKTDQSKPPGEKKRPEKPDIARWKKWLLYFILIVLIPAALIAALEGILRFTGSGYDTRFFSETTIRGGKFYTDNFHFTYTYFPATLASYPNQIVLPLKKAPGTVRIFVFGESAAMGDPDPFFSFSRILQAMLEAMYPSKKFEIVNTGITAINSHVILPIARECAGMEPDVFVVYMGNNEVVGPFGPATVFLPFQGNLSFIRFILFFRRTRIGQALYALKQSLSGDKGLPKLWGGMDMFIENEVPMGDPKLPRVYANFEKNLRDICAVGEAAGARMVLCTISSNLKDCAPFRSDHHPGLSPEDEDRWQEFFSAGVRLQNADRFGEALSQYRSALAVDGEHAELNYRMGVCHLFLGQADEARSLFARARDRDRLRFRADTEINRIIREVAGEGSLLLADCENDIQQAHPESGSISGSETFLDHVHLNFHGNYVLALSVLQQVGNLLSEGRKPVPSQADCAERLGYTHWEAYNLQRMMVDIFKSSPFIYRHDNEEILNLAQADLNRLGSGLTVEILEADRDHYLRVINSFPEDWMLRQNFGSFLLSVTKNAALAAPVLKSVLEDLPYTFQPYLFMGQVMAKQGRYDEAVEYFEKCLSIRPVYVPAHRSFAEMLAEIGDHDRALIHFEQAFVSEERLETVRKKALQQSGR